MTNLKVLRYVSGSTIEEVLLLLLTAGGCPDCQKSEESQWKSFIVVVGKTTSMGSGMGSTGQAIHEGCDE